MRHALILLAVGSSAIALAGCGPDFFIKPPKNAKSVTVDRTIARLDCPKKEGVLTLVSAAPDGKSCEYEGADSQVTLKLVSLNGGDAATALSPIETELKALMPDVPGKPEPAKGGRGDRADINLPGVHIQADDNGAKVNVGGVHIDANDDRAEVRVNQNVSVSSDEDRQTVTVKDDDGDVDVQEERSNAGRKRHGRHFKNVRATYMLVNGGDKVGENGYRVVGYDARGPKDGPLAVAVVKSRQQSDRHDGVFVDAKELVIHNVGAAGGHIRID